MRRAPKRDTAPTREYHRAAFLTAITTRQDLDGVEPFIAGWARATGWSEETIRQKVADARRHRAEVWG